MREAGDIEGVAYRQRDGVALSRDQRRGNRPLVAGDDGAHTLVDFFAHEVDGRGKTQPQTGRDRRRFGRDRAEHVAGGADPGKIHIAGKVVAAGAQGRERRRQMRADIGADGGRGVFAHGDAHALGCLSEYTAIKMLEPTTMR